MEQYQSQEITKLAKALLLVQRVLQPAVKDALNPFAKNRYASLTAMRCHLRWKSPYYRVSS